MCAQLGSGIGSQYPGQIDTRQTYRNGVSPAPDSDTRVDAEVLNDTLAAVIQIQTALGANPGGAYGSLAARLAQFLPGGVAIPTVLSFTGQSTVVFPGAVHHQQSPALLYQVWDTSIPRQAVEPSSVTVDPTSYDFTLTFGLPQSGTVVVGAPSPLYTTLFTDQTTLTIPGTAHGLAFSKLFYQVYDMGGNALVPGPLTIDAATRDVTLYFGAPQSGLLVLSTGGPRYEVAFSSVSTLTVPGSVHGLGSAALLYQLYDARTPAVAFTAPVTVHPTTFDVTASFGFPTSGTLVLTSVAPITGQEFDVRSGGIVNQGAVRMRSNTGRLELQAGTAQLIWLLSQSGQSIVAIDTANARLGVGAGFTNPAFQLQLSTGPAAKPDGTLWTVASDERLKTVLGPFADGLDLVLQLAPVWFEYNGLAGMPTTGIPQAGLIAQTLQPLAPYMVGSYRGKLTPEDTEETDILTYDGNAMTFVLINAIQALAQRVETLEAAHALTLAQSMPPTPEEPHS